MSCLMLYIDLDFSAVEEPINAVKDYVDNIDLSFDYSLPDLESLATFPCTINMGYFSRWIDESDLGTLMLRSYAC